jgi:hypothetical protein
MLAANGYPGRFKGRVGLMSGQAIRSLMPR